MNYLIRIHPKFTSMPDTEWFENYVDSVVDAVDNYCSFSPRSFYVTFPTTERVATGDYSHFISIVIESKETLSAAALFELLNPLHPLLTVNVQDYRFKAVQPGKSIYWTNEGECKYHDGSTYVDPAYVFHFNKTADYEIFDVKEFIKRRSEADRKKYDGWHYMWSCTGSWDNKLEATTLDEAIEEFEKYYQKQLWRGVEGYRKHLEEATDNFAQFEDYRWRKM